MMIKVFFFKGNSVIASTVTQAQLYYIKFQEWAINIRTQTVYCQVTELNVKTSINYALRNNVPRISLLLSYRHLVWGTIIYLTTHFMRDAEEAPADGGLPAGARPDHVALVHVAARLLLGDVHFLLAGYWTSVFDL